MEQAGLRRPAWEHVRNQLIWGGSLYTRAHACTLDCRTQTPSALQTTSTAMRLGCLWGQMATSPQLTWSIDCHSRCGGQGLDMRVYVCVCAHVHVSVHVSAGSVSVQCACCRWVKAAGFRGQIT